MQTARSSWNGKAHHRLRTPKIQLNLTSISIAELIFSTSTFRYLICMDLQSLSSGFTGNLVTPTRICLMDPTRDHAQHVFRGWLKAEVQRLLTHSSNPSVWLEECRIFYEHLRNRGYPVKAINATFSSINWNQRQKILGLKMPAEGSNDAFFAEYRGCVFSNQNAPGTDQLRGSVNLSLKELRAQEVGQESQDIFPPRAFFAVRSALPMGCILRR